MPNTDTIKNTSLQDMEKALPQGMKFIDPEKIIKELEVAEGMKIADFGCGTGYFTIPLAQKVGDKGEIYALDILESKLESVKSQKKLSGLNNIATKRVNLEMPEGSKLEKESVDWVILVNMLFQNNREGREKIMQEAKRVLKKGGHILVIEWSSANVSMGPDKDLRIPKEEMTRMAHERGLGVLKEINIGSFHYGLILAKYK